MRRWAYCGVAALVSALAYYFSRPGQGYWPLAWVAPAPILAIAFESSRAAAVLSTFTAVLVGSAGDWRSQMAILPLGAVVGLHAVEALVATLVVLESRKVVAHLRSWISVLAFPSLVTSASYLFSRLAPDGTAGSPAYTQVDFLPLIQVASLTGLSGISFLLALVPSGLALAWHRRRERGMAIVVAVVPLAVLLSALAYGWARLAQRADGQTVRVGLAATDATVRFFRTENRDEALPVLRDYARRIGDLAARGSKVVVLPEKFVGVTPAYLDEARDILAQAARTHRVTVVAGFNQIEPLGKRNRAYVFSPDGTLILEYDKAFTLPLEGVYHHGTEPGLVTTADGVWGVAICKDMDFPRHALRYSEAGVRIMFVPAWDFVLDGHIHSRMAVLRGIEGGYAIARTAQEGLLTSSDHRGRVLAEASTSDEPEVLLTADVPAGPGTTFYARTGDWFAWCNVLAAGALSVAARRKRRG